MEEIKKSNRGNKKGVNHRTLKDQGDLKKRIGFQIKAKHVESAKIEIQILVDKINSQPTSTSPKIK